MLVKTMNGLTVLWRAIRTLVGEFSRFIVWGLLLVFPVELLVAVVMWVGVFPTAAVTLVSSVLDLFVAGYRVAVVAYVLQREAGDGVRLARSRLMRGVQAYLVPWGAVVATGGAGFLWGSGLHGGPAGPLLMVLAGLVWLVGFSVLFAALVIVPVAIAEDRSPFDALRRSWALVRRSLDRAIIVAIGVTLVTMPLNVPLAFIPRQIGTDAGLLLRLAMRLPFAFVSVLTVGLWVVSLTLLYRANVTADGESPA